MHDKDNGLEVWALGNMLIAINRLYIHYLLFVSGCQESVFS